MNSKISIELQRGSTSLPRYNFDKRGYCRRVAFCGKLKAGEVEGLGCTSWRLHMVIGEQYFFETSPYLTLVPSCPILSHLVPSCSILSHLVPSCPHIFHCLVVPQPAHALCYRMYLGWKVWCHPLPTISITETQTSHVHVRSWPWENCLGALNALKPGSFLFLGLRLWGKLVNL